MTDHSCLDKRMQLGEAWRTKDIFVVISMSGWAPDNYENSSIFVVTAKYPKEAQSSQRILMPDGKNG